MNNTTIYFIRHGEVDNPKNVYYGRSIDVPLNEEGKENISQIAKKIKSKDKIDIIYTSPLSRTFESAKIIASVVDCPVVKEENLIEVDIPALVGHPLSEHGKLHEKGLDEYGEEFIEKGNESREHIAQRMLKAVCKIYKDNKGKNIVIVSHGDPLYLLFFLFTNPNKPILALSLLREIYFPQKGEGWKMIFDENMKILETELISRK